MKIQIYTKTDCVQCKMTKNLMEKCGLEFEEINLDDPTLKVFDLVNRGIKTLPVISVNDFERYWTGFKPDNIKKLEVAKNEKKLL